MKKIILLLFMLISLSLYAQINKSPQVKTANGIVQGIEEASCIHSFKGLPFAQPPVGNLRWKEPQPPKSWKGVLVADHFGPQAMQQYMYSDMMFRSNGKSEDCLYLNVWTPAKTAKEKLSVMVYFYGGGFNAGDGSEYRYDGESMAEKGIVTITVNYRLGIFGFLAHPELTNESVHHSSGNYGLMDQHAALLWVKKNIAAFGGDPDRVTIAGESAGSMSVCAQVASPLSKGLFAGAIGESGSLLGNLLPVPLREAEKVGELFAAKIGVTSLAGLREIPADSLLKMSANSHFPNTVDGYFIPENPQAIFSKGKQMDVPLLAGWNSAEANYHWLLGNNAPTVENYRSAIKKLYGGRAEEVMTQYPAATDADVIQVATDLSSDRFITYATWKFIDMQKKTGRKPVYNYIFTRKRIAKSGTDNLPGASHSSEIEYALGNLSTNKAYAWTADDFKVSETMGSYFANFIKTGDPNGEGLPTWFSLKSSTPKVMVIDVNTHSEQQKNQKRYKLMDSFFNK